MTSKTNEELETAEDQAKYHINKYDYDTKDFPVETIIHKYSTYKDIYNNQLIIPVCPREFIWDTKRQSRFIESIIMGLPIPPFYAAEINKKRNRLEFIDGSQRIRTLAAFMNDELILSGLDKLSGLNGFKFSDLSILWQRKFKRKNLRIIVFDIKQDDDEIKQDIFERINIVNDTLNPIKS
jgi:uncharacterized protein with ParB-like and HNH nuclease domain